MCHSLPFPREGGDSQIEDRDIVRYGLGYGFLRATMTDDSGCPEIDKS